MFPEPVNADYLLLAAEKAPVRVFELEYIMGDVLRRPADVSADALLHRKLLCREYHNPKGYSKVPTGPDDSAMLAYEQYTDCFRTELAPTARRRTGGFLETSGYIRIDEPGIYVFRLNSVGLSKFSLGGVQLIKQMDYQTSSKHTGTLQLEKGFYPYQVIFVPYYEGPVLDLEVKPPEGEFMPLPIDWLYAKNMDSSK